QMAKAWGRSEFWGLSADYDPEWILTEEHKQLRDKLMDLCKKKIRPHAIHCDRTYEYPRESLNAMAELGLLGLIVPKELGGLGQDHVCSAMVCETLARYGCPSTAMVYTMHLGALSALLLRYHNNPGAQDLLRRLDKDKLVGTLANSDPATGGHFWSPMSSKVKFLSEDQIQLLRYGSWVTSAGHADFYLIQTISPNFSGDYSKLCWFLVYQDEVRASTDDWNALGMHGNQSGPLIVEGKFSTDRMIGPDGDGGLSNVESVSPYFLINSSACWNGISLACMDVAKKHVTRKAHADVGMRVCDYPTIQDYFGESMCSTNMSRALLFMIAQALDDCTNQNDWSLYSDLTFVSRSKYLHWLFQCKLAAAKNVSQVTDTMLHSCGGSAYKTELGLERLLRDGKAGWLMAPSNEVLCQIVGKTVLMGMDAVDLWEQRCNERSLHHELKKMSLNERRKLAKKLLEDADAEEGGNVKHPYQDTDFENPFNTKPPTYNAQSVVSSDGVSHSPALTPNAWKALKLVSQTEVSDRMASFVFALPNPTDHTGCLAGQYILVNVNVKGKEQIRYFSPVSRPDDYGRIELVLRFETHGLMSQYFKALKPGDEVDFQGPCGGFEYVPNQLDELTLLASGGGITPAMQIIRCIMNDPRDKTLIKLIYFSENCNEILYKEELDQYAGEE
ncbi:unnamed protein product, partial [Meganyctiphanes norvegica]